MESTDHHPTEQPKPWSWIRKFSFRLIGTYLVLYIFPFPLVRHRFHWVNEIPYNR